MRKFYRELFYAPKYEKVSDKVMTIRVALSAFIIVSCLTVLSLSTYAWFSFGVASGTNTIKTADFNIAVSVTAAEPEQGVYKLADGEYSVFLTKTGNAKTGFGIVEITVGETKTILHTQQLGKDGEVERGELTFTLKISGLSEPATVSFTSHWGTSVYYSEDENPLYIDDASVVSVTAEGVLSTGRNPREEETSQTISDSEQTELIHTVVEGENLYWIAEAYNTTPEAIAAYNKLEDMRVLQIGQQLKIPPVDWVKPEDTPEQTIPITPEPTEPEATEPEPTEPEVTEPEPTESEATEPGDAATDSTTETTEANEA